VSAFFIACRASPSFRISQKMMLSQKNDAFAKKQNMGWLCKKLQLQGAQLLSNEAYLRTSKQ